MSWHCNISPLKLLQVLVLTSFLQTTAAQNSNQEKRVSGTYNKIALEKVLSDISKQTNIRFSYSPKQIPSDSLITISFSNESLQQALQKLQNTAHVDFELIDNYIVLRKAASKIGPVVEENKPIVKPKFILSGFIKDSASGEFLPGATLYIRDIKTGALANGYGFFSVSLPEGRYKVELSFLGYEPREYVVDLSKTSKLDFILKQGLQRLEDVVVSSVKQDEVVFRKRASQQAILPSYISQKPSIMGEPDMIKSLESLPGIVFQNDGSSFFHVRGGNYDQNLIILDDAPIFNPSHLLGIFSPIIPDAIQSVDVYKSDYPVNFGGRLSSVVDIRTKDGNKNKFSASGTVGLISARGTVEGPLKKESSSYFVSYRRSYFDAYLKPNTPNLNGLYFNDFTGKVNIKLSENDRLFFTLYSGKDVLRTKLGDSDQSGLNWGNTSTTLRWNHMIGSRAFLNSTLCYSGYNYYLYTSVNSNTYWNSRITNLSLKDELSFYISPDVNLKNGVKLTFYGFNPGNYFNPENPQNVQVSPVNSSELTFYSGVEHRVLPGMLLNYGMRFTSWSNSGEAFVVQFNQQHEQTGIKTYKKNEKYYSFVGLEPRFSMSVKTGANSNAKASYSRNYQFLNLISNSLSPFNSLEVWLPAGPNIKPQYADIVDVGFVQNIGLFKFSADIYYKWLCNQIAYVPHASMLVNPVIEGELRQGSGKSYGIELSLHKDVGRLAGGIDYTYSRAILNVSELNGGHSFPAAFDRPHNASFELVYHFSQRWEVIANYHIMSGMRITSPTSFFVYQGTQTPVYSELNNAQMPVYKRFDISTTINLNKPSTRFEHTLTIAVVNFFNHINPVMLYYNKIVDADGKLMVPSDKLNNPQLKTSVRYVYGFIPSVSYHFKF